MKTPSLLLQNGRTAIGISVLALIVTGIVLLSCEPFQPEGEFFLELDRPVSTSTIVLNDFNDEDTITIYVDSYFEFNVADLNLPIRQIKVTLNDFVLHQGQSPTGTFSLTSGALVTGTYKLKILLTTGAGTGSLADRDGSETVEVWREWTLIIDRTPPPTPVVTLSNENGFVKVTWDAYTKPNFLHYVFTGGGKTLVITDPTKTTFIDSAYVGGTYMGYQVLLATYGTGNSISEAKSVNDPQSFSVTVDKSDSTATFTWRRSHYPGAFLNAILYKGDQQIHTITDPNDTTVTLKASLIFGLDVDFKIIINARYPLPYYNPFSETRSFYNPLGFPRTHSGQVFYYSSTLGALLGYSPSADMLRRYDQNMKAVDSIQFIPNQPTIPYPGQYMYYPEMKGVSRINLVTKSKQYIETKGYYGSAFMPNSMSGADNGYVTYGLIDNTYNWDPRYNSGLIDFDDPGTLLWSSDVGYDVHNIYGAPILSDNGSFATKNSTIFAASSAGLTFTGYSSGIFRFRHDNNAELILRGNPITIVDPVTQAVVRTSPVPEIFYELKSYDPATQCLFYSRSDHAGVYLVHIETDEVTKIDAWGFGASYANGFLFGPGGIYIKVK